MMPYQLRRGLSFCDLGPHLVFLDVDADRYFCLGDRVESDLRLLIAGEGGKMLPPDTVRGLIERGVLVADGEGNALAPCLPPATPGHSLLDGAPTRKPLLSTVAATLALGRSLGRLRVRSLRANLSGARKPPMGEQPADLDRLRKIADAFDRAARWLSSQDRCLGQSIAVARAARRAGIDVDVVIGVALGPFVAHCWVQYGPVIVNDRVETVSRYTPILVA